MSIGLGSSPGLGWEFCWEWTWKCSRTGVGSMPAVGWEAHRDQAWKGAWIGLKRVRLGSMLGPGWEVYQDQDQCMLALGGKFTGTRQGSVCCLPGCGAGLDRRITVLRVGTGMGDPGLLRAALNILFFLPSILVFQEAQDSRSGHIERAGQEEQGGVQERSECPQCPGWGGRLSPLWGICHHPRGHCVLGAALPWGW